MDEDRRIRFLVAPTLFIASLLWGAWFDPCWHKTLVKFPYSQSEDWGRIVGLIAGGGFLLFVAGYVIGTLTYVTLRLLFPHIAPWWTRSRFHEVALSERDLARIRGLLGLTREITDDDHLAMGVAFDFGIVARDYEGVHRWSVRRWNAFSIGATSTIGVLLSFVVGPWTLGITFTPEWFLPVGLFGFALWLTSVWAWNDAMRMLSLMAALPPRPRSATAPSRPTESASAI